MKAVIYARYSSHNQREESIEGQLRECYDFAKNNDLTIIGEYIDRAISGKTDQRPDFQRLIKDSEKGTFEAVVMYTLDRFARNRYDSAIYKAKLKKNGVKVFYAKQPMPDSPEGIILESVLEGYAEYYSENLARSIKRGQKENALHAVPMGSLPLGYKAENKKYMIDPMNAKAVRIIFQMYADGHRKSEIINYLNEKGYKTKRGNDFNKNSLGKLLRNDAYIGTYHFADVTIEDAIPPIIDKKLFYKVQETLARNSTMKAHKKAKEEYLLTGKAYCGHCGKMLIGESGTSKTGKLHTYYKCVGRKRDHSCKKLPEKKKELEEIVVRCIVDTMLTDDNINKIAARTVEILEEECQDTSYLDGLHDRLRDTQKRLNNVLNAIEQGIVTSTTKDRLRALEEDRDTLEAQIALEEIRKPAVTKEAVVQWLSSFKNGDITSVEYKRKIIDTLLSRVYVYDDKLVFVFNTSDQKERIISRSDIEHFAPLYSAYPNSFYIGHMYCMIYPK